MHNYLQGKKRSEINNLNYQINNNYQLKLIYFEEEFPTIIKSN